MKEWKDKNNLYKEYIINRLSISKIAKKYNKAVMTVYKYLKRFNIPIRTRGEAISGKYHPFYGKCRTNKTREKIRKTNKKKKIAPPWKLSPCYKKGWSREKVFGKEKAKEMNLIISKKITGLKRSKETRKKLREHRLTRIFPKKQTKIERIIEKELKNLNISYKTNYPIKKARTQVDFYLPNKVIIYCDGDYWHNLPDAIKKDKRQNKCLKEMGYKVLRFWEHEINKNLNYCIETIKEIYNGKRMER